METGVAYKIHDGEWLLTLRSVTILSASSMYRSSAIVIGSCLSTLSSNYVLHHHLRHSDGLPTNSQAASFVACHATLAASSIVARVLDNTSLLTLLWACRICKTRQAMIQSTVVLMDQLLLLRPHNRGSYVRRNVLVYLTKKQRKSGQAMLEEDGRFWTIEDFHKIASGVWMRLEHLEAGAIDWTTARAIESDPLASHTNIVRDKKLKLPVKVGAWETQVDATQFGNCTLGMALKMASVRLTEKVEGLEEAARELTDEEKDGGDGNLLR